MAVELNSLASTQTFSKPLFPPWKMEIKMSNSMKFLLSGLTLPAATVAVISFLLSQRHLQ
jgi:hypothetical protein